MSMQVWRVLGIGKTDDKAAIRRAYAARLKGLDLDRDVAAYASLRHARDTALRLAAHSARRAMQDNAPDLGDYSGLPDDDFTPEQVDPAPEPEPAPAPTPAPADPAMQVREQLRALDNILFPGGERSDEGFNLADYDTARQLVAALIAAARGGRLDVARTVDHQLAGMLADAWPRSAALVEAPAAEFNWLDEAGSLDERPALRFLNDRIKGMRFAEKVQAPDHPLNQAWVELTRAGSRVTMAHRWATRSHDVRTLLTGMRQRFAEVESLLNPDRVQKWEQVLGLPPGSVGVGEPGHSVPPRSFWRSPLVWIIAGFAALMVLGALDARNNPAPPRRASYAEADEERLPPEQVLNQVIGAATAARLDEGGGAFARVLNNVIQTAQANNQPDAEVLRATRRFARRFAMEARAKAGFAELVAIDEAMRMWLRALERQDALGAECPLLIGEAGSAIDIALTPEEVAQEQALYARLLDARLLRDMPEGAAQSAAVPGAVIDAMVRDTGLTREQVATALGDEEHPDRCRVALAGLNAVLDRPADVPVDLLRLL